MNTNPIFKTNPRFKKFAYRTMVFITMHWCFLAPNQPIFAAFFEVHNISVNSLIDLFSEDPVIKVASEVLETSESENPVETFTNPTHSTSKNSKTSKSEKALNSNQDRVFKADINEGIIGLSAKVPLDNPIDNLFQVSVDKVSEISENDRVFLNYELYGAYNHNGVSRSINGRRAQGGYVTKEHSEWSVQTEEIDKNWLKEGVNEILFTIPKNAFHQYKIRNLSIQVKKENPNVIHPLLVITNKDIRLQKEGRIYIKGFVKGASDDVKVFVGQTAMHTFQNSFEGWVSLDDISNQNNFLVVKAIDANGLLGQELLLINDHLINADTGYSVEKKSESPLSITLQSVKDTLSSTVPFSATSLRFVDTAPLTSGIRNVTKGGSAYRVVSKKIRSADTLQITIPYDSLAIPAGYTVHDIKTFYFNTTKKSWLALKKDSLDIQNNRITSFVTTAKKNGGTDYINGIIQTPESPTSSSFTPTMMNDIQAVNPSAAMTLIAPPTASQRGDANISYPIRIPGGRNGMQPSVALQYSNEGGNGWLGMGWNLTTPRITIDTRWGTPQFTPGKESEIYTVNGEMLMYPDNFLPHRHQGEDPSDFSTTPQSRNTSGTKIFTPRKQGSFAQVERFGNNPTTYYWKVTDAYGTVSWYGGDSSGIMENSIVRDDNNNVSCWALFLVEDVFGNTMKYSYTNTTFNVGGSNNLNGGTVFYPNRILYTGYQDSDGNYSVDFETSNTVKEDASIDGRLGLKWIDPYLLEHIEVKYQGNLIRSYDLNYSLGRFTKNLLQSVTERDKEGNEFYTHDFEYYDDVADNDDALYTSPVLIDIPELGTSFANNFGNILLNKSAINSSETIETGYNASVSAGVEIRPVVHSQNKRNNLTIGAPFGENSFRNKGKISLTDINGDGIDDVVYRTTSGLEFLPGKLITIPDGDTDFINDFEDDPVQINNASDFYRSKGFSKTVFGESYEIYAGIGQLGFFGATKRIKTRSESNVYFTDGNGDDLIDIVSDEVVYFNTIDSDTGEPTFVSTSEDTENMVITASGIGEPTDPDPDLDEDPELEQRLLDFDAVRMWIAPYEGTIKIEGKIRRFGGGPTMFTIETATEDFNNNEPFRIFAEELPNSSNAISLTHYDNDAPLGINTSSTIDVQQGQRIFFRIHTNDSNPVIQSELSVEYVLSPITTDENGLSLKNYIQIDDFVVNDNNGFTYPSIGAATINFPTIDASGASDETTFRITQAIFNTAGDQIGFVTILDKTIFPGQTNATVSTVDIDNQPQEITNDDQTSTLSFEVLSNSNSYIWSGYGWAPTVTFTPNEGDEFTKHIVPDLSIYRASKSSATYTEVLHVDNWNTPPSGAINVGVQPLIITGSPSPFNSNDNGEFRFIVKRRNNDVSEVVGKRLITIENGVISIDDTTPIANIFQGNLSTTTDPDLTHFYMGFYANGVTNKALVKKYLEATQISGTGASIEISYNFSDPSASYTTNAIEFYNDEYPHLGPLHRGWGHFFYNENYDGGEQLGDNIGNLINQDIVDNPQLTNEFNLGGDCPQDENYADCVNETLGIPTDVDTEFTQEDLEALFTTLADSGFQLPEINFIPVTAQRTGIESASIRWVGLSNDHYFTPHRMRNVNFASPSGGNNDGGGNSGPFSGIIQEDDQDGNWEAMNLNTGMHAVNKKQASSTRTFAGGFGPLALNISKSDNEGNGYSRVISEFRDINGDRYPDPVFPNQAVVSNMTGGHTSGFINHNTGYPSVMDTQNQAISISGTTADFRNDQSNASSNVTIRQSKTGKGSITTTNVGPLDASIGISVNVGNNNGSREEAIFMDVNGDGLPDRIVENQGGYRYQLNKGGFNLSDSPLEIYTNLNVGVSEPSTLNLSAGFGEGVNFATSFIDQAGDLSQIFGGAFSFNAGLSGSSSTTRSTLLDINGDGLTDILVTNGSTSQVLFNNGQYFGSPQTLTVSSASLSAPNLHKDARSRGASASIQGSLYFGFPVCCILPIAHVKFGATLGGSMSLSIADTQEVFKDFNGDGFTDYVQENGNDLRVFYSAIGRTNKLKSVQNPLGGSFIVDYEAQAKSYNNPNAKWVLKSVLVNDGYDLVNDGEEEYLTEFSYENARYDRREREFYGFEKVLVFDYQEDLETVYRTTVSLYHNDSYFLGGLMKESYVLKGADTDLVSFPPANIFSRTHNFYTIYGLEADNQHIDLAAELPEDFDTGGREGRGTASVLLTKTETEVYELTEDPIVSRTEMVYDGLGRVHEYLNFGDITDPSHDFTSTITYHENPDLLGKNLIQIPEKIQVHIGSTLKRERISSNIDSNTGTIGRISAKIDATTNAITDMEYDAFGNLQKVTYPENLHGERMFYDYTYDSTENKYLIETTDAYGYTSKMLYDYEFDTLIETEDIAGNKMNYEYDLFARTTRIIGPKEQGNTDAFTIKYQYFTEYDQLSGIAQIDSDNFMPVSVTSHYDVQNPENPIETYTFIDGLSRAVQVKKDIRFSPNTVTGGGTSDERMSISGKTTYDHLGRSIKVYHPWHEEKDINTNFEVNNYEEITFFSETRYDELDRSIQTIDAASSDAFMEYTVEDGLHKTTSIVDQNDSGQIISHSFEDAMGRIVQSTQVGPDGDLTTTFAYNAINERESYTDADALTTTFTYDLLGRKTQKVHPDSGTSGYSYDQASNLIQLHNQRLLDAGTTIDYDYEYTRPIATIYPGQENISNVILEYGGPTEGNNTGRVIMQQDATGIQEFSYGNMGELEYNSRTVVGPNIPVRNYETRFLYDSWNRLIQLTYPDGEQVNYTYDHGGSLKELTGEVNGQPYPYIKDIQYDHYEQTTQMLNGNGTQTTYTYTPELRRLNNLKLIDGQNNVLLDNTYAYDKVRNVTGIQNSAGFGNEHQMGGNYRHAYSYDILNRLTKAEGRYRGNGIAQNGTGNDFQSTYNLSMQYNNTHGIAQKTQKHIKNTNAVVQNSYDREYRYQEGTHRVIKIEDPGVGYTQQLSYDVNGNTQMATDTNGDNRRYFWDEIDRLRVVQDQTMMHHYIYDASNQRILKSSSDPTQISENGSPIDGGSVEFDNYTTYPSNLIVMKGGGEYTKHYFNGSQRVVSRIGEESATFFDTSITGTLQGIQQLQVQDLKQLANQEKLGVISFKKYVSSKDEKQQKSGVAKDNQNTGNIYFFHPDHLGTATYLTDASGNPYQFFLNLPFGETMAEQSSLTEDFQNRWKFNGKELDSETNLYYYGARYYNPVSSLWLSVDPMADKFPNWSPYNYTMQNPVNLIDPDGKEPIPWYRRWFGESIQPWQWYSSLGVYDWDSFHSAATYSTQSLKTDAYQSIEQRSAYYRWVDQQISTTSRWFEAAHIVTEWNAVGAADSMNLWYLDGKAERFLRAGNEYLFNFNMANAKSLINNGKLDGSFVDANGLRINFDGLSGKELDYAIVAFEQTKVQDFIAQYQKDNPNVDINKIIKKINTSFSAPLSPKAVSKALKENFNTANGQEAFDFKNYNHRVLLGQRVIDQLYKNN